MYCINVDDIFIEDLNLLSGDGKDNFKYGLTRLDLVNKFIKDVNLAETKIKSKSKHEAYNIIRKKYSSIVEDHTTEMLKATPSCADIKKRKVLQLEIDKGSHTMTISVLNNNANKVIQLTKQMEGAITNILQIVKNNESDICRVTILSPNLLNEAGPGYVQHQNIDLSSQKQTHLLFAHRQIKAD